METTRISLEQTGRFNRLILDYIDKDEKLNGFYSLSHTKENYAKQIEDRKKFPIDRDLLTDSLLKQYEFIGGAKESVLKNIESLRSENTFTITTGHQLNIFTGPLYFVYKILHAIKLTDELRIAYPKNNFVPIYWMNSEDHDQEEIGQFNLFGKKRVWETDQSGSTGKMNPNELIEFCSELEGIFSNDKGTLALVDIFKKAYSEFPDLATATRYFSDRLFGKYGLVIIDSNDAQLKRPFAHLMKRDIISNQPFDLVRNTNQQLVESGYHVQVNPRQINLFYLADGIRNRIVATEKGFKVFQTDIRFSESELSEELQNHPERFSPNVVLRPLFQELVLPNLTYVGGAGELSYWLQYKAYFNEMGVSFPLLSLRNHFLLIDAGTVDRMDELNLLPEDLFKSIDELVKEHVLELSDADVSVSGEIEKIHMLYHRLKQRAQEIDASLSASIESEETRLVKAMEQWGGRFSRSLKKNHEVSVNRIRNVYKKLFPNDYLQERHDNFLEFQSKYNGNLLDGIYENTHPFDTQFTILRFRKS